MKNQEDNLQRNFEVERSALQANIERKEYILQTVELKIYHYEKYLQRKSLQDREAYSLLNRFQQDEPAKEQKVSNVIEDNLNLKKELTAAFQEINMLEMQQIQKKKEIYSLTEQVEKLSKQLRETELGRGKTPSKARVEQRDSTPTMLDDGNLF